MDDSEFTDSDTTGQAMFLRPSSVSKLCISKPHHHGSFTRKLLSHDKSTLACYLIGIILATGLIGSAIFATVVFGFGVGSTHLAKPDPDFYRPNQGQVLLLGDSLTQKGMVQNGWVSRLAQGYVCQHDVLERGYGGYNSRQWVDLVDPVIRDSVMPGTLPALITILLGTNDAYTITASEFRSNMMTIISNIKSKFPSTPLVLFTPPPPLGSNIFASPDKVYQLYQITLDIGVSTASHVIDLWKSFFPLVQTDFVFSRDYNSTVIQDLLLPDGVHLSISGNSIVYTSLYNFLNATFPNLVPGKYSYLLN
ncbi:hypothetical protein QVD99_004102 [Batrachochytrium dendrobatidis]|nr:hypothetical protein QVD99_004102 [Batrachochytrium dendrobatidis]